MKLIFPLCFVLLLGSCFLRKDFRHQTVTFNENQSARTFPVIVPKGFSKQETKIGTSGNEENYFYYPGGALLYFVRVADTTVQYQPIDYQANIPKTIYGAEFFKGLDSTYRFYWRENRIGKYKIGYRDAGSDTEWRFDSAVNYFTLRLPPPSIQPIK